MVGSYLLAGEETNFAREKIIPLLLKYRENHRTTLEIGCCVGEPISAREQVAILGLICAWTFCAPSGIRINWKNKAGQADAAGCLSQIAVTNLFIFLDS